jgi:hypothetical protein
VSRIRREPLFEGSSNTFEQVCAQYEFRGTRYYLACTTGGHYVVNGLPDRQLDTRCTTDDACEMLWRTVAELLLALPLDEILAMASIGQAKIVAVLDGMHVHLAERGPFGTFAIRERRSHIAALWAARLETHVNKYALSTGQD